MSDQQLALNWTGQPTRKWEADRLRELLREVVDRIGVKQVAFDLDIQPSRLVYAMQGGNRYALKVDWLPYLLTRNGGKAALEWLAQLCGFDLVERQPAEPEEELAALRAVMSENMPAEWRATLESRVRARLAERRK